MVSLEYKGPIKAPIQKGQEIAKLKIFNKKKLTQNLPMYTPIRM